MRSGQEPHERVGQVGPVELTSSSSSGSDVTTDPTVISDSGLPSGPGPLGVWWHGLSPWRRRTGVLLTSAVALGLVAATLTTHGRQTRATPYPAYPAPLLLPPQTVPADPVLIVYQGIVRTRGQTGKQFTLRFTLTNTDDAPMTVLQLAQQSPGVVIASSPPMPIVLQPAETAQVRVAATVQDCAAALYSSSIPYLSLILGAAGRTQFENTVPGDVYPADLSAAIARDCPFSAVAPPSY